MLTQEEKFEIAWRNFRSGTWEKTINVRDFIQRNYQPYSGDDSFLAGATDRTKKLWEALKPLLKEEVEKGVLGVSQIPSTVAAHAPGYIDKKLEIIVGLQTDEPLKRAIMPKGGWRAVEDSLKAYGYEPDQKVAEIFTKYAKTHNDGVFDAYTEQVRKCRKSGIITGLPDAYGRGRIIGDYRRLPLYGLDFLIQQKIKEKQEIDTRWSTEDILRLREELSSQIRSLKELKMMAESYGFDVSHPATNAREAVQWLYFAFLAAVKEQNGAAMSVGRISTFLDIYIERDLEEGTLTESQAQELIDDLVIKFRLVRFLRTPSYNQLFSGDPTWVTESIGGMGQDGRTIVTKNSFRMLNTLYTIGPAPEPNLTVLWSTRLPQGFKDFVAKVSIDTSSIQYMNDDLMRPKYGDDAGIACCVSAMALGKQMQFFGARVNLLKTLLYSLNGGKDEISGTQVGPIIQEIEGDYLDYAEVMKRFEVLMDWLARTYVDALNIIHYMHDKYCYESILMAFHDRDILRTMAFGLAGLSHTADSLSAIKYAKVKAIRNEAGLIVDFKVEGEFPRYGNNDERADDIAVMLCSKMMEKINSYTEALKISKGGLTISGGEPGFQHAFVKKIFKAAKKLGLHTCLDTSGFLGANFSDEDLMDIDLHLLDIKSGDPEVYKLVTKQSIQPTLELAERLSRLNRPVWVRFVLVPGLTDSWENVEKVADICANIQSLERVEILRFHQLGKSKWEQLGINYTLAETETPALELVERVRSQFKARNLTVY